MTDPSKSAADNLRAQMRRGTVATVGTPTVTRVDASAAEVLQANGPMDTEAAVMEPPVVRSAPLRPGEFSKPPQAMVPMSAPTKPPGGVALQESTAAQVSVALPPSVAPVTVTPPLAPKKLSATERLQMEADSARKAALNGVVTAQARREMSTMKTLTRMLEAVYARPGSTASEHARMKALSDLAINARELGAVVARVAGDDVGRSNYIEAMATDAAVGLVCHSWEAGEDVDWPRLLQSCVSNEDIVSTADNMAYAQGLQYAPIEGPEAAADRLAVSMHSAFWRLIDLGQTVDGMVPKLAAQIVRESTLYLQGRDKFVSDTTLHVSWMQSSLGRMTNLICAELRARFGGRGVVPTREEVDAVLAIARSGFEGVENYAQSILEKSCPVSVDRPGN